MSASPISLNFIAADVHLFLITLIVPIFGGAGVFCPALVGFPDRHPFPPWGFTGCDVLYTLGWSETTHPGQACS